LAAGFGRDRVYSRMFRGEFKPWAKITDEDLNGYRAYTDLSNYCDLPLSRPCLPIALLRDPVHRAVSLYYFVRRKQAHEFHRLAMDSSVQEFYRVGSSMNPVYFRNLQTTRICGVPDAKIALEFILTRYLAVGFTAHIDEFVQVLSRILALSDVHVDLRPHADRHEKEITPQFRDMVLSQNEEDRLLFEAMMRGAPYRIPTQPMAREITKRARRVRDRGLALARGAQRRIVRLASRLRSGAQAG
jgi:hypothetical protein